MSEGIPIRCPECRTSKTVDVDDADDILQQHNEECHNGAKVAGVPVETDEGIQYMPAPDRAADLIAENLEGNDV